MHDESRISSLDQEDQPRLLRLREVLERVFRRRTVSVRTWVEEAWMLLGGPACAGAAEDLDDAEAFFNLLEEMDEGGTLDTAAFQARIETLFANPDATADDSVQVMSIHKAKGLEFDTVIVPGLGRKPRSDDSRLMLWLERPRFEENPDLLLAPIQAVGSDQDRTYNYLKGVEARKTEHETGRLLYVAATRARSELHLLGHTRWKEKDGRLELSLPESSSLLRRMWAAAEPSFKQAAEDFRPPAQVEESSPKREPRRLQRLASHWSMPVPDPAVEVIGNQPEVEEAHVSFDWVGSTLRHVGTVVHQALQRIGEDGLSAWGPERVGQSRTAFRSALASLGVPEHELEDAVSRVERAIQGTISDERGRWILQSDRAGSACEYAMCGFIAGHFVSARVDRTFVDADGVRWIVDYKTSFHEGSGLEGFLDNELARYRDQLTTYRTLFGLMDNCPVRAGLYFPLLSAWRGL